jgi:DcaP outer membrane protein
VKQSRLIFGTDTPLDGNPKDLLQTRFEVDLFGSSLGDQRTTNTYGLQVRHAFVQWRKWLVGQTWSNFEDAAALPDAVDFIGSTDGTVFVRQPQVRWTSGGLSLSAENTETTISPYRAVTQNARVTSDDSYMPDLVAKYTWKGTWGQVSAAALGRQLKYRGFAATGAVTADDSTYTGSLGFSGKINLGPDDIRFALVGGNLGRYVGLNFANDAVLTTNGVTGVASLDAIEGYAGFVAWRHPWSKSVRTNLYYAMQSYDNDEALTGGLANAQSWSVTANVFYSPLPKLDIGAEFRHAVRELESGADGSLDRVQLTTKYSF